MTNLALDLRLFGLAPPLTLDMARWGDGEYYGTLPVAIASGEKRRDVFEIGDVALWPEGNAFCIFFGPTPASRGNEPRMASPGIPMGKVVSGAGAFETLGPNLRVRLAARGGWATPSRLAIVNEPVQPDPTAVLIDCSNGFPRLRRPASHPVTRIEC